MYKIRIEIVTLMSQRCSRLLLSEEKKKVELRKINRPNLQYLEKKNIRKRIIEMCRKVNTCPYCGAVNGEDHLPPHIKLEIKYLELLEYDD